MAESKNTNYIRGAAILASTVAIVKVIGAIYKVPLYNLLGDEGTAHFNVAYTIYNFLLSLATAGIPVAISRLVSAAYATNRRLQVKRYFSVGIGAFFFIGVICMAVMIVFDQELANFMQDPEVALGVRVLAPAVLFSCLIAIYRGYTQGFNNMVPTAISQISEVLCKLIFGLSIAWILVRHGQNSAVVSAGAIVGVTIGLGVAIPLLAVCKHRMDKKLPPSTLKDVPDSRLNTLRQILRIGVPIMLSSSILNIISLIDTRLVLQRLQLGAGFSYFDAKVLYGVYSKGVTLFNLPNSFIVPITVSIIPVISAAIARRNSQDAKIVMESSIKVTNLLALPAGAGLCVLSYPIFNVLYPDSDAMGPSLLSVLGIASYFICIQLVTNAILQATGHEKFALLTMPVGGLVKIAVDWFLVGHPNVNIMGAPISTIACYVVILSMDITFIKHKIKNSPNFIKVTIRPLICTIIMAAAAWASYGVIVKVFGSFAETRIGGIACLAAAIIIAVIVYLILVVSIRAVTKEDMNVMPKGEKLAKLLHLK